MKWIHLASWLIHPVHLLLWLMVESLLVQEEECMRILSPVANLSFVHPSPEGAPSIDPMNITVQLNKFSSKKSEDADQETRKSVKFTLSPSFPKLDLLFTEKTLKRSSLCID